MDLLTLMNHAPSGKHLLKALKNDDYGLNEPKSAIIDPTNALNYTGTRARNLAIPMQTLRAMGRIPAVSAIIATRLNQVARFAKTPRFEGDIGFKIVTKDIEQKMSPADKKEAQRITKLLLNTGLVKNRVRKDNFDRFLRKVTKDSLELDQMCWEHIPSVGGGLAEFWAIDGATIELVVQEPTSEMYQVPVYRPETRRGQSIEGEISYVQRVNGQILAEYTEDELCFAVRNPQTDVNLAPFGVSELEILLEVITGIVNGVRYNTSYFNHSYLPQGVLELIGSYKDEHLEAFKRMWKTLTSGATGKWAVPVMAMTEGQGFKWTPFKNSNRDMEFNQFMEFMFNLSCAVYQIDPNEVGFKSWTSKQGGMTQSDNTEAKIEQSQDKGFIPLMTFLGQTVSSEIIDQVNEEFCLAWEGLDDDQERKTWNKAKEELEAGTLTVNEYRVTRDRKEIPDDWANAPANSQLIQVFMADKQAAMQQDQMAAQGDQQLKQIDAQHNNAKDLTMLQHGNAKEMQGIQNDKAKDLAGFQHDNTKDLTGLQHKNAKEMQGMQQDHELSKQGKEQAFQKEEGAVGRWHDSKMADKAHGQQKEMQKDSQQHDSKMSDKAHGQQKDMQKDSQQHDSRMSDKSHGQQKELSDADRKHQERLADKTTAQADKHQDKEHKFQKDQSEADHVRGKDMADHNHGNAKDMAKHSDELKRKGDRQASLFEGNNQSAKKKQLQKSLSDLYLIDHPLVECLAERVHESWMKTAGTSDNPDMGPYEDLHEAVKETDRACVRAVIEELVKQGIIPDEDKLKKAIETAEFEETPDGTVIVVNPWETY